MRFLGEGGWWRTPIRAGQAQRAPMRRVAALMAARPLLCEAAVWSAVVPQRVRAIGHYLQQRSMRNKRQLTYSCALFSLSQLKQVLAASKTLASRRTREGPLWASLRISRSPPIARCDACLSARLCLSAQRMRSVHVRGQPPHVSFLRDQRTLAGEQHIGT